MTNAIAVVAIIAMIAVAVAVEKWRRRREAHGTLTAAEITELMEYLRIGERIVVQFGDGDVLTAAQLDALRIADLRHGARGIAGRGSTLLNQAAEDLAKAATEVTTTAMPEEKDILAAYRAPATAGITAPHPRDLAQIGIRQERAVRDLKEKIDATWQILRAGKRRRVGKRR